MSNTIQQFNFRITKMKKEDSYPFSPYVQIVLERLFTTNDGASVISSELMTEDDIDRHIYELKADLDVIGKKAKAGLRHAIEEAKNGP